MKTDVTRFYPSIYTHSIAWAIVGKAHAKTNHSSPAFISSYANQLDKAVGAGQEGQTIGIPIGPDTSRILSELIAVSIEEAAKPHIPNFENRSVRFVDDILIGLEESETPAAVLSGLSLALYEYQLELNAEKTATFGLASEHTPEWIHFVRTFELNGRQARQREDLDSFFEQSVYLADRNTRDSALLFAVKRAASFPVDELNIDHLVMWMLYCARRSATCLSFVAEYLSTINNSTKLPNGEIESYILQQIPIKSAAGHTDELAWLLFWAREIKLIIPQDIMANVMVLRSSVVGLLVLDLWHSGLIEGALDFSFWQGFANDAGLKSEMWLIAYEATRKGWWPKAQNDAFITKHPFFSDIWAANVEFYDTKRRARGSFKPAVLAKSFERGGVYASAEYPM